MNLGPPKPSLLAGPALAEPKPSHRVPRHAGLFTNSPHAKACTTNTTHAKACTTNAHHTGACITKVRSTAFRLKNPTRRCAGLSYSSLAPTGSGLFCDFPHAKACTTNVIRPEGSDTWPHVSDCFCFGRLGEASLPDFFKCGNTWLMCPKFCGRDAWPHASAMEGFAPSKPRMLSGLARRLALHGYAIPMEGRAPSRPNQTAEPQSFVWKQNQRAGGIVIGSQVNSFWIQHH